MKQIILCLLVFNLMIVSCGKRHVGPSVLETISSETSFKNLIDNKVDINERSCIDELLAKELEAGESIKKLVINTDIDFCNGVRVRLKTYKFASKKYKAYGFVRSNSGHESCLKETEDFSNTQFFGDKGVLVGDDVLIILGGHQFNSDKRVIPSEHRLARFVKFDWKTYKGEMAFFEKDKLRCWAIQ